MQTVVYLIKLFSFLAIGAASALLVGKQRFHRFSVVLLDVVLYLLLFLMGVNTGSIPNIGEHILMMGIDALIATILVLGGSIASAVLLGLIFSKRVSRSARLRQPITLEKLKNPLRMMGVVLLGLLGSALTPWFGWFDDSLITIILYLMLFFVGMQMVQQEIELLPLLRSPMILLLPLATIIGTYAGILLFPLFSNYTIRQALTMVSGFGWYSLSGVMISSLGDPRLGAVSFLSNLFREMFSFVLVPFLAAFSSASFSSISVGGATSMDVMLPLLRKSLGETAVPLAIVHGMILSLLGPFLIPLWFG
ncbi:MAG: lysine exporter LysO family protein [Sphaerochaetaceae bacterium]